MHLPPPPPLACGRLASLIAAALIAGPLAGVRAAEPPHQHGHASVELTIDDGRLTVALRAPLDTLVGFERKPRGQAEHKAVTLMAKRLRDGAAMVQPSLEAACVQGAVRVQAPALEGAEAGQEHAELQASWMFDCLQPAGLARVDLGLFNAFSRLQAIEVQVVGPAGQNKVTLTRPQRRVAIAR